MTRRQISLIKSSWSELISLDENPGIIFYTHLFEMDHSLKKLFKEDMKEQSRKFTSMITFFAYKLDDWEEIIKETKNLGKRHKLYQVPENSYKTVEIALLKTLQEALAASWSQEAELAWKELYLQLELLMLQEDHN